MWDVHHGLCYSVTEPHVVWDVGCVCVYVCICVCVCMCVCVCVCMWDVYVLCVTAPYAPYGVHRVPFRSPPSACTGLCVPLAAPGCARGRAASPIEYSIKYSIEYRV
jgi:hypothetical protein